MRRRRGRAARGQARGRNEARRAADGARQEHSKHPEHFAHSSWTTSGYDCPRTPVRGQLQAAAEEQTKLVSLARAEGAVRRAGPGRAGGRAGTAPTRIPTVWACPALPPPAAASQPAWARAAWAPQLPGPAVPCARG